MSAYFSFFFLQVYCKLKVFWAPSILSFLLDIDSIPLFIISWPWTMVGIEQVDSWPVCDSCRLGADRCCTVSKGYRFLCTSQFHRYSLTFLLCFPTLRSGPRLGAYGVLLLCSYGFWKLVVGIIGVIWGTVNCPIFLDSLGHLVTANGHLLFIEGSSQIPLSEDVFTCMADHFEVISYKSLSI